MHRAVLSMVVRKIPNPRISQQLRLNEICKKFKQTKGNKELYQKLLPFKEGIEKADPQGPLVAFVSKMNHIPNKNLNEMGLKGTQSFRTNLNETQLYAFARVFSGELKRGGTVQLQIIQRDRIGQREDNTGGNKNLKVEFVQAKIDRIYIWMGQYLQAVESAGPGSIVAIGDLGEFGFKSVTICDNELCPQISKLSFEQNLLKVSIKPREYNQMGLLNLSLKKLMQADPVVEVYYDEKGDLIIACGGEEHLRRCIVDITEDFESKEEIVVSDPIITFKETIITKYRFRARHEKNLVKKQIITENQKAFEEDMLIDNAEDAGEHADGEIKEKAEPEIPEESSDLIAQEPEKPEEIDYEKLHRQCSFSSSYFETTSEEEELTNEQKELVRKKMEQEMIENWHDSDEDKEDAGDVRFIYNPNIFKYKQIKDEVLNVTKKNKVVNISKNELVDLKSKKNHVELKTPNGKYKILVQACGLNEELAQWLYSKRRLMSRLFNSESHKSSKQYITFFKELEFQLNELNIETLVAQNIMKNLVCFGPSKNGNNILCSVFLKPQDTLMGQFLTLAEMAQHFPKYFSNCISQGENQEHGLRKMGKADKDNRCDFDYSNLDVMGKFFNDIGIVELKKSLESGFNVATRRGPLCGEEMFGTMFVIEDFRSIEYQKHKRHQMREEFLKKTNKKDDEKVEIEKEIHELPALPLDWASNQTTNPFQETTDQQTSEQNSSTLPETKADENKQNSQETGDSYGPLPGQLLSTMKQACIESFLGSEPRLVQGLYSCTIFCDQETNSKAFEVLSKRHSKILSSDYQELTNMFIINALVPIQESFGFHSEMMIATSGRVIPELKFSGWKMIEEDPFYEPKTIDEVEEHGEKMFIKNGTRQLIDKIRLSKGMQTADKVIVDADKQETRAQKRQESQAVIIQLQL